MIFATSIAMGAADFQHSRPPFFDYDQVKVNEDALR